MIYILVLVRSFLKVLTSVNSILAVFVLYATVYTQIVSLTITNSYIEKVDEGIYRFYVNSEDVFSISEIKFDEISIDNCPRCKVYNIKINNQNQDKTKINDFNDASLSVKSSQIPQLQNTDRFNVMFSTSSKKFQVSQVECTVKRSNASQVELSLCFTNDLTEKSSSFFDRSFVMFLSALILGFLMTLTFVRLIKDPLHKSVMIVVLWMEKTMKK